MDPATLYAVLPALLVIVAGWVLFGGKSSAAQKRLKSITAREDGRKRKSFKELFEVEDGNNNRRKQIEETLTDLESRQKDKLKQRRTLKARLVQADLSMPPQTFLIISVIVGVLVGGGVYFLTQKPLMALGAAFVIGFGIPRWVLGFIISRRQKKFIANFADAMDIIVRGVRSGLPLGDCLKMIAHEASEPVAGEFLRVVEAETIGVPLDTCLEQMYERLPISEVNFFATVLNIQRSTGGNLGEALETLSKVLRGRKVLREKIKALSGEAKASAIIVGCLPLVVMGLVSVVNPEYMEPLYTTKTGHRNLMIGAGMMMVGIFIMRKMINFKY